MSKKGQGLAFVSILVLIAILYFVFRYNTDTYSFIMNTGEERAHLVTAYTESAKAKSYVELSARQAAFEALWNISGKSKSGSALNLCANASFQSEFKSLFDTYLAMYAPTTDLIETTIPDYNFSFTCSESNLLGGLKIEGKGHSTRCVVSPTFPFPQYPCEDQGNKSDCTSVKFTTKQQGACLWNSTYAICTDSLPEPYCSGQDTPDKCKVTNYCKWQESYSEPIRIVSAPLINYQFSIEGDAHFVEDISGSEYVQFTKSRAAAFKPSCSIILPATIINNAKFNISVKYTDDGAPKDIELSITQSFTQFATANLTSSSTYEYDSNDKIYDNGKDYYYNATLANSTKQYNVDVTCTDGDGNPQVTASKSFTVSAA